MPKFEIVTSITVTLEQTFSLYADDATAARELFEDEGPGGNIVLVSEEMVNVIGDRQIESIDPVEGGI